MSFSLAGQQQPLSAFWASAKKESAKENKRPVQYSSKQKRKQERREGGAHTEPPKKKLKGDDAVGKDRPVLKDVETPQTRPRLNRRARVIDLVSDDEEPATNQLVTPMTRSGGPLLRRVVGRIALPTPPLTSGPEKRRSRPSDNKLASIRTTGTLPTPEATVRRLRYQSETPPPQESARRSCSPVASGSKQTGAQNDNAGKALDDDDPFAIPSQGVVPSSQSFDYSRYPFDFTFKSPKTAAGNKDEQCFKVPALPIPSRSSSPSLPSSSPPRNSRPLPYPVQPLTPSSSVRATSLVRVEPTSPVRSYPRDEIVPSSQSQILLAPESSPWVPTTSLPSRQSSEEPENNDEIIPSSQSQIEWVMASQTFDRPEAGMHSSADSQSDVRQACGHIPTIMEKPTPQVPQASPRPEDSSHPLSHPSPSHYNSPKNQLSRLHIPETPPAEHQSFISSPVPVSSSLRIGNKNKYRSPRHSQRRIHNKHSRSSITHDGEDSVTESESDREEVSISRASVPNANETPTKNGKAFRRHWSPYKFDGTQHSDEILSDSTPLSIPPLVSQPFSSVDDEDISHGSSLPTQVKDFLDMFQGEGSYPDDFPESLRH